jgi:DNA-binding NtrC family response regulator
VRIDSRGRSREEESKLSLRSAGYHAVAFEDSLLALKALEHPVHIELLTTRVRFPPGTTNGIALVRMAWVKRPGIKVLFPSFPEVRSHTDGLGEFLPRPLSTDELLLTVDRLLDGYEDQRPEGAGYPGRDGGSVGVQPR